MRLRLIGEGNLGLWSSGGDVAASQPQLNRARTQEKQLLGLGPFGLGELY